MGRRLLLLLARLAFLCLAVFFAWWALRGRWGEIGEALRATPVGGLVVALLLTGTGLWATALVWHRLVRAYGHRLPVVDAMAIFFVGQLGKYIPGSVWSIGVQADLARRHHVPVRTTVGASLVFLGFHVVTAVVVGAVATLLGGIDVAMPAWLVAIVGGAAVLALAPAVVNPLGTRVGGQGASLDLGVRDTASVVGLMACAWVCYTAALIALVPAPDVHTVWAVAGAFAVAYALGVLVFLAPAGLGAREGVFVVLLTPAVGIAVATSVALLSRLLHTVADFAWAAVAHRAAQRGRR